MNERQKAYKLLNKLAQENDYVIVHSREIRMLLEDLKAYREGLERVKNEFIDLEKEMA
jgi:hypothetical protein